jgi:hypothetical protein
VPIITVISLPILPRAKYLQSMILNVFAVCIGAAMALLGIWTGLKARENTSSPGSIQPYNSSQSTVCAIWLFANIYFVNTARAKMPALQVPVIMYSIFTNVAFVYGHLFTGIAQVESFVRSKCILLYSCNTLCKQGLLHLLILRSSAPDIFSYCLWIGYGRQLVHYSCNV